MANPNAKSFRFIEERTRNPQTSPDFDISAALEIGCWFSKDHFEEELKDSGFTRDSFIECMKEIPSAINANTCSVPEEALSREYYAPSCVYIRKYIQGSHRDDQYSRFLSKYSDILLKCLPRLPKQKTVEEWLYVCNPPENSDGSPENSDGSPENSDGSPEEN